MDDLLNMHISQAPQPLLQRNPDMNVRLASLIDRMLAKSPADRPQSWQEVRETLETIRKELCPEKPEQLRSAIIEKPKKHLNKPMPQWAKMLIAIAAAFAAILIMALLKNSF